MRNQPADPTPASPSCLSALVRLSKPLCLGLAAFITSPLSSAGAPAPKGPQLTVVATGLNNPRGLTFGPSGFLYVAEAGLGAGDGHGGTALGIGFTATITQISSLASTHPKQHVVVTNLASIGEPGHPSGTEVTGPDGISYNRSQGFYVVMTESISGILAGAPTLSPDDVDQFGQLLKLTTRGLSGLPATALTPVWNVVADVGDLSYAWTGANQTNSWAPLNPPPANSPQFPDANPYAVLAVPGHEYVVDAAANTLNDVRQDGTVHIMAYFPNPVLNGHMVSDAVPTCVAQGADGWLYVGTLAFSANAAAGGSGQSKVFRVNPSSTNFFLTDADVWADGLNPMTGCGFGKDGAFYATEFTTNFPASSLGDVVRIAVNHDGSAGARTVLGAGALHSPNGFAAGTDGSIYVSNFSTSAGTDTNPGQVVRVNY